MHQVVLIPGDGIGPEISDALVRVFAAAKAPIAWVPALAGMAAVEKRGEPMPDETLALIRQHGIALKGPLTTPVGKGFRSINVLLRQTFELYTNLRPARSIKGLPAPCGPLDLVLFRENTQGLYSGEERWADADHQRAESIAVITRSASEKIVHAAFQYARKQNRHKVTLIHKANILKLSQGLFLQAGRDVAAQYPEIQFEEMIVDNAAMQMVMRPQRFDVMVTTNLFGDILSDLASGLVGGLGVTGSANLGDHFAIFEAVHGSAPDIAGQDKANPSALLFSSIMMLRHLGELQMADRIETALLTALESPGTRTGDLGGQAGTHVFADEIIKNLG